MRGSTIVVSMLNAWTQLEVMNAYVSMVMMETDSTAQVNGLLEDALTVQYQCDYYNNVDLNECLDDLDDCNTTSSYCVNSIGGYYCECLLGFNKIFNNTCECKKLEVNINIWLP